MYYEEVSEPSYWPLYVMLFVVSTIVICLLLNIMANLAERISPELRTMQPGQVWLAVIPVFGSFWIFHAVMQLANMLREEFSKRKIVEFETSPGLSSGLGFCFTLFVAQITLLFDTPVLAVFLYIAAITLLALYWSKLSGYTRKLDHPQAHQLPFTQPQQQWPQSQPYQYPPPPQWQYPPAPQSDASQQWPVTPPPPPADEWEKWRPK
jgi:hypothetical protein